MRILPQSASNVEAGEARDHEQGHGGQASTRGGGRGSTFHGGNWKGYGRGVCYIAGMMEGKGRLGRKWVVEGDDLSCWSCTDEHIRIENCEQCGFPYQPNRTRTAQNAREVQFSGYGDGMQFPGYGDGLPAATAGALNLLRCTDGHIRIENWKTKAFLLSPKSPTKRPQAV